MRRSIETIALFIISLIVPLMAHGHGGDATTIHSCVNKSSGDIRIVGANASCKTNETALDWNQAGSTTTSISTRVVVSSTTIPGDFFEPVSVSVSCDNDEWLTGGGFDQRSEFDVTLDVLGSSPMIEGTGLANGWMARAKNRTNRDQVLTVFALCASSP